MGGRINFFVSIAVSFILIAAAIVPQSAFSDSSPSYSKKQILKSLLFIQEDDFQYAFEILSRVDPSSVPKLDSEIQFLYFALRGMSLSKIDRRGEALQDLEKCASFRGTSTDTPDTSYFISECLFAHAIISSELNHSNDNSISEKSLSYLQAASRRGHIQAQDIVSRFEADQQRRRDADARQRLAALTQDLRKACLGMTEYPSDCYGISDPDLKHLCIANSDPNYQSDCYSIKDKDIKHLCIARAYPEYQSDCYSIQDPDLKKLCIAYAYPDYRSECYSIKTEPWRTFCGGLALAKTNCYNLK